MSLSDWLRFGWLTEQRPTASEIRDLLAVVDRDLVDCRVEALEMIELAEKLAADVRGWLASRHPELLAASDRP